MDINKIARKIADENNIDMVTAENMAKRLETAHPDIQPVIAQWLNGKEIPYEFREISLEVIKERDKCSFISAVLTMSFLLKKPKYADGFLSCKITTEDMDV